uniref:Uncharacterized protein n=1 Tax=Lepeophtheirus salmonis TaxID=72036 RepID=A0A0K2TMY4_LEPSM
MIENYVGSRFQGLPLTPRSYHCH